MAVIESRRGMGFILLGDAVTKVTDARRREFFNVSLPALLEEMERLGITKEELIESLESRLVSLQA